MVGEPDYSPKNQEIWVQFEHTKQLALRFAQSKLKKVATEVFNCARRVQKKLLLQIGHLNSLPFTSTVKGSLLLNRPIFYFVSNSSILIVSSSN